MLKKSLLSVLIAVSTSPLVAIAADSFSGAPTPVQTYRTQAPASTSAQNEASAMAQVQAIMAKAKEEAALRQAAKPAQNVQASNNPNPTQQNPTQNLAQASQAQSNPQAQANNGNIAQNTSELAGQVSTLNQNTLMYEQRTDQQIETLAAKNADLTMQLSRMGQALNILNQEVVQLNSQIAQLRSNTNPTVSDESASLWQKIKPELLDGVPYVVYAAMAALVVIVLLMLPWYRRDSRGLAPVEKTEAAAEYDFMGSHEAIPAKLDLARAYIAMEDHHAAKQVLLEIQQDGDVSQQAEAEKLLDSIANKL